LRGGSFTDEVNAVGAGYAFGQADSGQACGPEHADTVGRTEIGVCERLREGGMAPPGHDELRVDGADLAGERRGVRNCIRALPGLRSRLRDPVADNVKGLPEVDAVDADAQNLY